jgi:hypothetical protein
MLLLCFKLDDDKDILINNSFFYVTFFFVFRKMNNVAIQRFVEYIQIKTVQPEPDYKNALKFLKHYAHELGLEYRTITIDDDRHAAVLTVNNHLDFSPRNYLYVYFSGYHRRQNNRFCSIRILMLYQFLKNIGLFHHFPVKFEMEKSMVEVHRI